MRARRSDRMDSECCSCGGAPFPRTCDSIVIRGCRKGCARGGGEQMSTEAAGRHTAAADRVPTLQPTQVSSGPAALHGNAARPLRVGPTVWSQESLQRPVLYCTVP